jgi:hypothetical protein
MIQSVKSQMTSSSSSSYKTLQPVKGSGSLNHLLSAVYILCYILPIAYIHVPYVFQNVIFPARFRSSGWTWVSNFNILHNIISVMRSTCPSQFNLCFLIKPNYILSFQYITDLLIGYNPPITTIYSCRTTYFSHNFLSKVINLFITFSLSTHDSEA